MSDTRIAFHAMFPAGPADAQVAEVFDAAAAAVGLSFEDAEQGSTGMTRRYGEAGLPALGFRYTLASPCQVYVSIGLHRPGREPYAPPRIANAFTRICIGLDADLGRSDLGGGYGFVHERELDGPLEFIDWYQYLGPRIVARIGRERLLRSPAFKSAGLDGGAILMTLAPDPWAEDYSRAAVADHLGITLRPLIVNNPATGEPRTINWR